MSLESARGELDRLDAEIVRLLDKRAVVGKTIGDIKRREGMALYHPERETEVLRRLRGYSDGSFPAGGLERIYQTIMRETLALQKAGGNGTCQGHVTGGKYDVVAVVTENVQVAPGFNRMRLLVPELAGAFRPGQFFQLRIGDADSGFFLRRPFAPSEYLPDGFAFFFSVVGAGTEHMASLTPGSRVGILAPLGNAFTLPEKGVTAVLFGGGYGAPSLAPLAAACTAAGNPASVILGARTVTSLLNRDGFEALCRLVTATDDGSHGCRGTVVDAFRREVSAGLSGDVCFYACGPIPMLRAVAQLAREAGVRCEVSLEERMACGFGACMGCAVPVLDGEGKSVFRRVCHEGPVFDARALAWDEIR